MPIGISEEHQELHRAVRGWVGLAVDEADGGEGAGFAELVVVAEELGRAGAPGPFLAHVLATAVVQRAVATGATDLAEILGILASGEVVGCVALDGALVVSEQPDGRLRVTGELEPVLSAHLAGRLVAPTTDGWIVLEVNGAVDLRPMYSLEKDVYAAALQSLQETTDQRVLSA